VQRIKKSRKAFVARLAGALPFLVFPIGQAFAQGAKQPVLEGRSSLGSGSRAAWLVRVEEAKARYEAFAARARLSVHPQVLEAEIAPARPASFLEDTTLRRGDVVVTPEGLMVFRGSKGFPYASSDFDPVRSPAAARASHAPELIELQRAHELGKP
jgi:hypothetical protein